MTERITIEADSLAIALKQAAEQLGANSAEEIGYEFDKEHFRQGAYTVKLHAFLKGPEVLAKIAAERAVVDDAKAWMEGMLGAFGSAGSVSARKGGDGRLFVEVLSEEDARLLIGKQGRNIRALQATLEAALARKGYEIELKLDVESPEDGRRDRDDRGGRGRGRDRDDRGGRGRGRDRDDRGGRGRGRDRDRDPARDEEVKALTREAADVVLSGDEDAIKLPDMNSYERHLAHATIKEIDGVDSRSVGRGDKRNVEVFAAE